MMIAGRDLSKFLVVLALGAAACGGSSGDGGGGPPPDGGGMVSFAQDIQPIFNSRCTSCHNAASLFGGLDLTAAGSYDHLVNVPTSAACAQQQPGVVRVKPGDTMGSMLWRKTKPDPSLCFVPMPRGTAGLGVIAPGDFAKLEAWIQQGALRN